MLNVADRLPAVCSQNASPERRAPKGSAPRSSVLTAWRLRGHVTDITTEGGPEHIELLAQRYPGAPYQWYGGRDQVRVILTITATKIHSMDR